MRLCVVGTGIARPRASLPEGVYAPYETERVGVDSISTRDYVYESYYPGRSLRLVVRTDRHSRMPQPENGAYAPFSPILAR